MTTVYKSKPSVAIASLRSSRVVNRRESLDEVHLDLSRDGRSLVGEILRNICSQAATKGRRLAYLNALVKYLQTGRERGYTIHQILLCLRCSLVHEATVIRLAALRALRYLMSCENDLIAMQETGIPFLVVRSLDIVLNNASERLQATRLCQRILAVPDGAKHFPTPITRALIAIAFDGHAEQDKLYRASLSLLCQLALLNPMEFLDCGGVRVLLHNILGCSSPMVLEAMIGSLLHLLNVPETRDASGLNLQALVAPFTDVHFKHGPNEPLEKDLDEREVGYQCAKTAIGAVLKSWGGIAHFCQSRNSGLQALIDALYIEQLEIRRTILDLICEILGVKFPTWSDEVSVALSAVDPSYPQDSWKLSEGFVVQEALSVLPHLAISTPNITANHMALVVLSFIQRGLLEALVEVIVTGDTFITVRGTVLLGELLSLVDKYIPLHCYDPSGCIPSLIRYSTSSPSTPKQQRAMEALSVLSSLQKIKARPATPSSLFLQAQLDYASYQPKADGRFLNKLGQVHLSRLLKREIEGNPTKLLKDTGVLNSKDSTTWQWDTILSLIKWSPSVLKKVEDSNWRNFLKRLIDYFKPSSNLFARLELGKGLWKMIAKTSLALVTFLAEEMENFSGSVLLEELLVDIASQLDEVLRQPHNPFGCFLSPLKIESTLSQTYFLMIGRLTHSSKGFKMLEKGDILQRFFGIVTQVQHESYTKLIVASLSYREEYPKRILAAALSSSFDHSRLFTTQFLRVLVRDKLSGFSKWGMELLVNQLGDNNRSISLTAMDILEEAIHDKMFLESLIALRPTLSHLGDRGLLLLICFLSLPSGFKFLMEANFLKNEIQKWRTSFNKRYVELVEVLVRDSVSTLRRGEDGKYPERASRYQEQSKFVDIYVPPHLYGQLAQHKDGLEVLLDSGDVHALIQIVNTQKCSNTEETRELKAALWALAHFATSADTVSMLEESRVLESMVELGRFCPILSVRHTVFHCLCLVCVTSPGTDALAKWDWHGMPRNHHESYTIWSPELYTDAETRRLMRLRVEAELLEEEQGEDDEKGSDTCSHLLNDEEAELYMMEEELVAPKESFEDDEIKACSLTTTSTSPINKWSHAHHRSQSDSLTLNAGGAVRVRREQRGSGGSRGLGSNGSWRWRADSVSESSGVSSSISCESTRGIATAEHVQTLSPIPSSASIATTICSEKQSPPSRSSSRVTLTEPVVPSRRGSWGSPAHRSIRIRKPIIRMPLLSSDSTDGFPMRRSLLKTGSLDRHLILSPGDLFESKIGNRVPSSLTSLSTPSFRIRPETKGPCYMGLCVPSDFGAIFLTDIPLHVRSVQEEEEEKPLKLGDSFEFHSLSNCLGCYKVGKDGKLDMTSEHENLNVEGVTEALEATSLESLAASLGEGEDNSVVIRKEALRLVSNLICCVGSKANEQGLLRLKQKFPWSFNDLCLYTEFCLVMSKYNMRLPLRRFLQELFYDHPFQKFYDVAAQILGEEEVQEAN